MIRSVQVKTISGLLSYLNAHRAGFNRPILFDPWARALPLVAGVGSSVDPATGRSMDNVKPMIENIEWLSAEDRKKIFEDNARAVFKLAVQMRSRATSPEDRTLAEVQS